jgi:hypothetical protein
MTYSPMTYSRWARPRLLRRCEMLPVRPDPTRGRGPRVPGRRNQRVDGRDRNYPDRAALAAMGRAVSERAWSFDLARTEAALTVWIDRVCRV